jgi:hypothetical protein
MRPSSSAFRLEPSAPIQPQERHAGVKTVRFSPTISQSSTMWAIASGLALGSIAELPGEVLERGLSAFSQLRHLADAAEDIEGVDHLLQVQ